MERKSVAGILIILLFTSFVFAGENADISAQAYGRHTESSAGTYKNSQKIWHVDSVVFKDLSTLYTACGFALPNAAGPWSSDELTKMLLKLPDLREDYQTEALYELYCKTAETLLETERKTGGNNFFYKISGDLQPEMYVHTNPKEFNQADDWAYSFGQRKPAASLAAELWMAGHFYSYARMALGQNSGLPDSDGNNSLYKPFFNTNIPFVPVTKISNIDLNSPDRAIAAAGGENWSLSVGRDVMRWGFGESGNLFLGGNAIYDNALRFAAYFDSFKYTFVTNFYTHPATVEVPNVYGNWDYANQNKSVDGVKLFMAHRADFRFFCDRMSLSIMEGMMYQSASSTFDLRLMNPAGFFHNYYIRGNSNSILGVDYDFTVFRNFSVFASVVLDDLPFGEPDSKSQEPWRPSKMGYQLGAKYIVPVEAGILKLSAEAVYTDPYLYVREKYDDELKTQGLSLYGYFREFTMDPEITYLVNCVGYKYGGNCITANLKADFDKNGKWSAGAEAFYMAHGFYFKDICKTAGDSDWIVGKGPVSPLGKDIRTDTSGKLLNPACDVEPEYFLRLTAKGAYNFTEKISAYCRLDNLIVWNKGNQKAAAAYDLQFCIGAKISF